MTVSSSNSVLHGELDYEGFLSLSRNSLLASDLENPHYLELSNRYRSYQTLDEKTSIDGWLAVLRIKQAADVYLRNEPHKKVFVQNVLQSVDRLLEGVKESVPAKIHFLFLQPPSDIELDYIKAWVRVNTRLEINLWMDSRSTLASILNQRINEWASEGLEGAGEESSFTTELTRKVLLKRDEAKALILADFRAGYSLNGAIRKFLVYQLGVRDEDLVREETERKAKIREAQQQVYRLRDEQNLGADFQLGDTHEINALWTATNPLSRTYFNELLTGNFAGAENLTRYQVLFKFGGIIIRPDSLPGINPEWLPEAGLRNLPQELLEGAIVQAVMESRPDEFSHRREKLTQPFRGGYLDCLDQLESLKPGIRQRLLHSAQETPQPFLPIDQSLRVIPGSVLVAQSRGKISDSIMAAAPRAQVTGRVLSQIEKAYEFLEGAGVGAVHDQHQAAELSYRLLEQVRGMGFSVHLARAAYYHLDLIRGGEDLNPVLNGAEVLREAIVQTVQESEKRTVVPEAHPLGQQIVRWVTLATEEHLALPIKKWSRDPGGDLVFGQESQVQYVLPMDAGRETQVLSQFLHSRHFGPSTLYAPVNQEAASTFKPFSETMSSGQRVLVGQLLSDGSFSNWSETSLARWLDSEWMDGKEVIVHCLPDRSVNTEQISNFFHSVLNALPDNRKGLNSLRVRAGLTQVDGLGRSWQASVSPSGDLTWHQGVERHWIFNKEPSGEWSFQDSVREIEKPGILLKNDQARFMDYSKRYYAEVLRQQGYTQKDGLFYQHRWESGPFRVQLLLDELHFDESLQPSYFFSPSQIHGIRTSIDRAFSLLAAYADLPENMPDDFTLLISLRSWITSGLYFTVEGITLVLDSSFLDSDVYPFSATSLADQVTVSERPVAILLHYLSLVIYERHQPEVFWQEFSAFHGDSLGCERPVKLSPAPETIGEDQAVSPLAATSQISFVAESLGGVILGHVLHPASVALLRVLLNRASSLSSELPLTTEPTVITGLTGEPESPTNKDNHKPEDHRQALYYGWHQRLKSIKAVIRQQYERSWLSNTLKEAEGWDNQAEIQVLASGEEGNERFFQLTGTLRFTLVQDYETGEILDFAEHDPRLSGLKDPNHFTHQAGGRKRRSPYDTDDMPEMSLEETLRGLLQGDEALGAANIPKRIWSNWQRIARDNQAVMAFTVIPQDCADILRYGLTPYVGFAPRGPDDKGIGADWAIQAGTIPFDAVLSSAFGENGFEHRGDIERGDRENARTLTAPDRALVAMLINSQTIARRYAQGKLEDLKEISPDEKVARVTRYIEWPSASNVGGKPGQRPIVFEFRFLKVPHDYDLWSVEYRSTDYGKRYPEYEKYRPLEVMGEKLADGSLSILTEGTELFALFKQMAPVDTESMEEVYENVRREEFSVQSSFKSDPSESELTRARRFSAIVRERVLHESVASHQGAPVSFQQNIIDQINAAAESKRLPKICHHGAEQDITRYSEKGLNLLLIDPNGNAYLTTSLEQAASILSAYGKSGDILTYRNPFDGEASQLLGVEVPASVKRVIGTEVRSVFHGWLNQADVQAEARREVVLPSTPIRIDSPPLHQVKGTSGNLWRFPGYGDGFMLWKVTSRMYYFFVADGLNPDPLKLIFEFDFGDYSDALRRGYPASIHDDVKRVSKSLNAATQNTLMHLQSHLSEDIQRSMLSVYLRISPIQPMSRSQMYFEDNGKVLISLGVYGLANTSDGLVNEAFGRLVRLGLYYSIVQAGASGSTQQTMRELWGINDGFITALNQGAVFGLDPYWKIEKKQTLIDPVFRVFAKESSDFLRGRTGSNHDFSEEIITKIRDRTLQTSLNRVRLYCLNSKGCSPKILCNTFLKVMNSLKQKKLKESVVSMLSPEVAEWLLHNSGDDIEKGVLKSIADEFAKIRKNYVKEQVLKLSKEILSLSTEQITERLAFAFYPDWGHGQYRAVKQYDFSGMLSVDDPEIYDAFLKIYKHLNLGAGYLELRTRIFNLWFEIFEKEVEEKQLLLKAEPTKEFIDLYVREIYKAFSKTVFGLYGVTPPAIDVVFFRAKTPLASFQSSIEFENRDKLTRININLTYLEVKDVRKLIAKTTDLAFHEIAHCLQYLLVNNFIDESAIKSTDIKNAIVTFRLSNFHRFESPPASSRLYMLQPEERDAYTIADMATIRLHGMSAYKLIGGQNQGVPLYLNTYSGEEWKQHNPVNYAAQIGLYDFHQDLHRVLNALDQQVPYGTLPDPMITNQNRVVPWPFLQETSPACGFYALKKWQPGEQVLIMLTPEYDSYLRDKGITSAQVLTSLDHLVDSFKEVLESPALPHKDTLSSLMVGVFREATQASFPKKVSELLQLQLLRDSDKTSGDVLIPESARILIILSTSTMRGDIPLYQAIALDERKSSIATGGSLLSIIHADPSMGWDLGYSKGYKSLHTELLPALLKAASQISPVIDVVPDQELSVYEEALRVELGLPSRTVEQKVWQAKAYSRLQSGVAFWLEEEVTGLKVSDMGLSLFDNPIRGLLIETQGNHSKGRPFFSFDLVDVDGLDRIKLISFFNDGGSQDSKQAKSILIQALNSKSLGESFTPAELVQEYNHRLVMESGNQKSVYLLKVTEQASLVWFNRDLPVKVGVNQMGGMNIVIPYESVFDSDLGLAALLPESNVLFIHRRAGVFARHLTYKMFDEFNSNIDAFFHHLLLTEFQAKYRSNPHDVSYDLKISSTDAILDVLSPDEIGLLKKLINKRGITNVVNKINSYVDWMNEDSDSLPGGDDAISIRTEYGSEEFPFFKGGSGYLSVRSGSSIGDVDLSDDAISIRTEYESDGDDFIKGIDDVASMSRDIENIDFPYDKGVKEEVKYTETELVIKAILESALESRSEGGTLSHQKAEASQFQNQGLLLDLTLNADGHWERRSSSSKLVYHRNTRVERLPVQKDFHSDRKLVVLQITGADVPINRYASNGEIPDSLRPVISLLQRPDWIGKEMGVTAAFLDSFLSEYDASVDVAFNKELKRIFDQKLEKMDGARLHMLAQQWLYRLPRQMSKRAAEKDGLRHQTLIEPLCRRLLVLQVDELVKFRDIQYKPVFFTVSGLMARAGISSLPMVFRNLATKLTFFRLVLSSQLDIGAAQVKWSGVILLGNRAGFELSPSEGFVIDHQDNKQITLHLTGSNDDAMMFPDIRIKANQDRYFNPPLPWSGSVQDDVERLVELNGKGLFGDHRRRVQKLAYTFLVDLTRGRPIEIELRPDLLLEKSEVLAPGKEDGEIRVVVGMADHHSGEAKQHFDSAVNRLLGVAASYSLGHFSRKAEPWSALGRRRYGVESVSIPYESGPAVGNEASGVSGRSLSAMLYGALDKRRGIQHRGKRRITRQPPAHTVSSDDTEEVTLYGEAGRLNGAYHKAPEQYSGERRRLVLGRVVLFLQGAYSPSEEQAEGLKVYYPSYGIDVLAVNFRGFGNSDGTPSEKGLYDDARTMFSYLVYDRKIEPGRIIIHGYGLGAAVAADLAGYVNRQDWTVAGVILDRPVTGLKLTNKGHSVGLLEFATGPSEESQVKFNLYEKLNDLPKSTPLMLMTDNEPLGAEGEKLRSMLESEGFRVQGEATKCKHEETVKLLTGYGDRIRGFIKQENLSENTSPRSSTPQNRVDPIKFIRTVWGDESRLLVNLGRKVGLTSRWILAPLPVDGGESLYRALVWEGPHDLKILRGSKEDFIEAAAWIHGLESEKKKGVLADLNAFIKLHPNDPTIADCAKALIAYYDGLPESSEQLEFRMVIGEEIWRSLLVHSSLINEPEAKDRLYDFVIRAGIDVRFFRATSVTDDVVEGGERVFNRQAQAMVEKGNDKRFLLVNDQTSTPSQVKIFKPSGGKATFGTGFTATCKRMIDGPCTVRFVELDKPVERLIIHVSLDDVSATDLDSRFKSMVLLEFEGSLYHVIERTGSTSIKGVKAEGITAVIEAWKHYRPSPPSVLPPRVKTYELSAEALQATVTVLVERKSGHIFQKIDGQDKAIQYLDQDPVFRTLSGTGELTDVLRTFQGTAQDDSGAFAVPVDPESEWLMIHNKDSGGEVSADEVLKALDVARNYVTDIGCSLKMVDGSNGAVGMVVKDPSFQEGGKYHDYVQRFRDSLVSYFRSDLGTRFIDFLSSKSSDFIKPAQLKGVGLDQGDLEVPELLRLILVLTPPESITGRDDRIKPYDPNVASITWLQVDPTMGKAGSQLNYQSHFSEVALDMMRASVKVTGSEGGVQKVAREVFQTSEQLTTLGIENRIRRQMSAFGTALEILKSEEVTAVKPVEEDNSPKRFGFEFEFISILVRAGNKKLENYNRRTLLAVSKGNRKGISLLGISTDTHNNQACVEVIGGPLSVEEYNDGIVYKVYKVLKDTFWSMPPGKALTVQDLVDSFNNGLSTLGGSAAEFKMTLNPEYNGDTDLEDIVFSREEESTSLKIRKQVTVSVNYETIGDPLSMVSELLFTLITKPKHKFFLAAQFKAAEYADQITSQPSAKLKSFLTQFFYNQILTFAAGNPDNFNKTHMEFLLRIGDTEPILSILDDSEVDGLDQYISSKTSEELAASIEKDIMASLTEGDSKTSQLTFKKLQLLWQLNGFKDAISARKKNGRFQMPAQKEGIQPNVDGVPVASGRRSIVYVGSLNPASRRPIAVNNGHYYVCVEVRRGQNPIMDLSTKSPAESEMGGRLSLLQEPDALGRMPEATRYFIENLEKTTGFYSAGREWFLSLLRDRIVHLKGDALIQVQDIYLKLIQEQGDRYSRAPGRADLLNTLLELQLKQLNHRLAQGQVTSGDQTYRLIEFYKRCEPLPQSVETYDGEIILIEFDPERSGYDNEYITKNSRQVMVVGVRDDLAYLRQGNHYRVVFDTSGHIEIEVVLDHRKQQKGLLPKTRLVINKEHYKQAFIEKRLRPQQVQADIDGLVRQFITKDSTQRLLALQKRAGDSLDMNSRRQVLIDLRPDWRPEESKVGLFDEKSPGRPVRIQVGVRLSEGQQYPDVAEKLYPLALAASYSPGDSGEQDARVDRRRAMVNSIWNQSDRLVKTLGEAIGMTSLGDLVAVPADTKGSLYHQMVEGQDHDLQVRFGTQANFRHAMFFLLDNGQLGKSVDQVVQFIDQVSSDQVKIFLDAVLDAFHALKQPVYGDLQKTKRFLKAIGERNCRVLSEKAMSGQRGEMEFMEGYLHSVLREVLNRDLAYIKFTETGLPFWVFDSQRTAYNGEEPLVYFIEDVGRRSRTSVAVTNVDAIDVMPFVILRHKKNKVVLIARYGEVENNYEVLVRVDDEASFSAELKKVLADQYRVVLTTVTSEYYDNYRVVFFKDTQQHGIELSGASHTRKRLNKIITGMGTGGDDATFNFPKKTTGKDRPALPPVRESLLSDSGVRSSELTLNRKLAHYFYPMSHTVETHLKSAVELIEQISEGDLDSQRIKDSSSLNLVEFYKSDNGLLFLVKSFDDYEVLSEEDIVYQRWKTELEVFASKFDQQIGLKIIPPARVMKNRDRKVVSLFIPDTIAEGSSIVPLRKEKTAIVVLDFILQTLDRGSWTNFLVNLDGYVYAIDHETIFKDPVHSSKTATNEKELNEYVLKLFFSSEVVWNKFLTTDWLAFFNENLKSFETAENKERIRTGFVSRIEVVKEKATQLILNEGKEKFFQSAARVSEAARRSRLDAMYDYAPVSVLPEHQVSSTTDFIRILEVSKKVPLFKKEMGSGLFTFPEPELRAIAFYVTDEVVSAALDRSRLSSVLKGISRSLELFLSRTKEGQQLRQRLTSLTTDLPRPASFSDIPGMESASLKGALPEQINLMVVLGGASSEAVQLYQKQSGFVALHIDPSQMGPETAISDTTEWFPKLAQAFSGLAPGDDALIYENRIREQLGLPSIDTASSDDLLKVDALPDIQTIEIKPTLRGSGSRGRRGPVAYKAWGKPLSGLAMLMPTDSDKALLGFCQVEAEQLSSKLLPEGASGDDARSLVTDFLFQSIKKARVLSSGQGFTGFEPLSGVADALAGAVSQETVEHLDHYIKKVKYESFAAELREALQRIVTFMGTEKAFLPVETYQGLNFDAYTIMSVDAGRSIDKLKTLGEKLDSESFANINNLEILSKGKKIRRTVVEVRYPTGDVVLFYKSLYGSEAKQSGHWYVIPGFLGNKVKDQNLVKGWFIKIDGVDDGYGSNTFRGTSAYLLATDGKQISNFEKSFNEGAHSVFVQTLTLRKEIGEPYQLPVASLRRHRGGAATY